MIPIAAVFCIVDRASDIEAGRQSGGRLRFVIVRLLIGRQIERVEPFQQQIVEVVTGLVRAKADGVIARAKLRFVNETCTRVTAAIGKALREVDCNQAICWLHHGQADLLWAGEGKTVEIGILTIAQTAAAGRVKAQSFGPFVIVVGFPFSHTNGDSFLIRVPFRGIGLPIGHQRRHGHALRRRPQRDGTQSIVAIGSPQADKVVAGQEIEIVQPQTRVATGSDASRFSAIDLG